MKKIKLKGVEDNNHYYLLESTELQDHEIGNLVKGFLEEGEIVKVIREGGVLASANQLLVMKMNENSSSVEYLRFDDDSQFDYLQ